MEPEIIKKLLNGDRSTLARLITQAESLRPEHRKIIQEILAEILPYTGNSIRIGITGAPGVGKSTFIESFGTYLTSIGKRVAVLSIDPSSPTSKGSILGDKTRMEKLSKDENAFIRPTASQSFPGGVSHATRESILLCEAAGFDVIIVETVGVGQTEFSVKNMTDCFMLLMLPGSGDELQGIKKGIVEMADIITVTKSDGDNIKRAEATQAEFQHALHLLNTNADSWTPTVTTCSSTENTGIKECWSLIEKFVQFKSSKSIFEEIRKNQTEIWLNEYFVETLKRQLLNNQALNSKWDEAKLKTQKKEWTVFKAVEYLMNAEN